MVELNTSIILSDTNYSYHHCFFSLMEFGDLLVDEQSLTLVIEREKIYT